VAYDASYYDAKLLDRGVYSTTLGLESKSDGSGNTITYSESSVLRGHSIYQQRFAAQQFSLCQSGQTPGRNEAGMNQPKPDTIGGASRTGINSPYSTLPELACLNKALRLMPGVKNFSVSSRRYHHRCVNREAYLLWHIAHTPWPLQRQSRFSLVHGGEESAEAVIIHARPWYPYDSEVTNELAMVWYRGFFVLQQAVAVSGLQVPISMDLDIHRSPSGPSHTRVRLALKPFPWFDNIITLPGLLELSITMMTTGRAHSFPDLKDCRVSAMANAAPNLTSLRMAMVPYDRQGVLNLLEICGSIVRPHLSRLRLEGFGSREDHLTDFITRHEPSLRHLELLSVGLAAAERYASADYDLPIWKGLFHRMNTLDLDHLLIQSLWSAEYSSLQEREKQRVPRSWRSDDRSRIHEFL